MNTLPVLPIVVFGAGALMVWGGLTGQSPVARVKAILTRGGVQAPATDSTPSTTSNVTGSTSTYSTYNVRRDYLS